MSLTKEADEELDQLADDALADEELGGPDVIYDDVWALLSNVHDPQAYHGYRCDERVQDFLELVQELCSDEDGETYDQDEYLLHVEQALTMLYRHFSLLLTSEINYQTKSCSHTSPDAFSPWKEAMVRRMMLYVFTGKDLRYSHAKCTFTAMADFEACLLAYRLLPVELRERAAEFIQVYSANFFGTETQGREL